MSGVGEVGESDAGKAAELKDADIVVTEASEAAVSEASAPAVSGAGDAGAKLAEDTERLGCRSLARSLRDGLAAGAGAWDLRK